MKEEIIKLFDRDLHKLQTEIDLFEEEENLWKTSGKISNSAGNLCLHLVGNLNTYIGKNLGNTGYVRNREEEFSMKGVPKNELIHKVKDTKIMVTRVLNGLPIQSLDEIHPENVLAYEMTNRYFLIHLFGHLSYHLGQINYLRRILE